MMDPTPIEPTPMRNALHSIAAANGSKKQTSPIARTMSAVKKVRLEPKRPII